MNYLWNRSSEEAQNADYCELVLQEVLDTDYSELVPQNDHSIWENLEKCLRITQKSEKPLKSTQMNQEKPSDIEETFQENDESADSYRLMSGDNSFLKIS